MKGMTCVSWVLLLTHVVMLPLCGLELSLVVNNFFVQDSGPPLPPPPTTTTTTTTPSYYHNYGGNSDNRMPDDYRTYTTRADRYARLDYNARLYVFVPCTIAATTSLLILTASCWSYVFTTTVSLYTTIGVWILSLVCTLVGQSTMDLTDEDFYPAALWILVSQVALLLLLSLQIVLAIWELRRQEASWPMLKLEHLFTWHAIFLVARMTLGVYVAILICNWGSPLMQGITMKCDYDFWDCPHMRFPIWLSLSGVAAVAYSLVVTSEALFSFLIGISDRPLTCITSVGSGMCNMWVAILASPFFIRAILENLNVIGHHIMPLAVLSTIASIVTFIHTMAYLFAPRAAQPPTVIRLLVDKLRALSLTDLIQKSTLADLTMVDGLSSKVKASGNFALNLFSGVVSVIMIIILACGWWGHIEDAWGMTMLFAVNISVLCRVVPAILLYMKFSQDTFVPFAERAVRVGIEGLLSLVGFIGTVASYGPPRVNAIVVGLVLLITTVIQILILANEYSLAKKGETKAPSDADHQLLEEEESDGEPDQMTAATTTTHDHQDDVALVA